MLNSHAPSFVTTASKCAASVPYFATCRWITFQGLTCQSDHASRFGASCRDHLVIQLERKSVWCWLGHGLSGRGPLFQGYWPTGQPGSASYWRTRNGSYSVRKFNYPKNCFLSVRWNAQTNFRIKYLKSEVLMGARDAVKNSWNLYQITAGVLIFSKKF